MATAMPPAPGRDARAGLAAVAVATALAAAAVAALYLTVVVPWADDWGSTAEDRAMALPGDAFVPEPYDRVHHVVTVHAPPAQIWPWLVQLGQDRAGFYSYDWLENIFLAGIRNRETIRTEWQARAVGDWVQAVQPRYLGFDAQGIVGWKVTIADKDAALGLDKWGTFALVAQPDGTTRLIARQLRSGPEPALAWPIVTFLLDPAHFVMERRMLLRIAALAEGRGAPAWPDAVARAGWWLGAAALAGYYAWRRRRRSFGATAAAATVVLFATGDVEGALAAYMGLGLALLGVALVGRWAGLWIIALGVLTYAVLALSLDAWRCFGLAFGALALAAVVAALARRDGMAKPRYNPVHVPH